MFFYYNNYPICDLSYLIMSHDGDQLRHDIMVIVINFYSINAISKCSIY